MLGNKRGIAMNNPLVLFIVGLFAVVILAGVDVLVLDAFNSSTTNPSAQAVFGNGITMFSNFTNQLGTVGTIGGVLIILLLVALAGLGGFAAVQRMR